MTETIRLRSGFEALVNGVAAYFEGVGVTASVVTGYRELPKQSNQGPGGANRVVFLPGAANGSGGKLAPPRDVGRQDVYDAPDPPTAPQRIGAIRPLVSWERTFVISVWAQDRAKPRDELAQIVAAEELFEQLVRAVESVKGGGGPNMLWGAADWVVPKENTYGAEIRVTAGLAHPLMDAPDEIAFPGFELVRVGEDPE